MPLYAAEHLVTVQALIQLRETFIAEHDIHPDRPGVSGPIAYRAVPHTKVDSAALLSYITEFTALYARLWDAGMLPSCLPDNFNYLDFRHLKLDAGLSIVMDDQAGTGFGLRIDFRGSVMPYLQIFQAEGHAIFEVDLCDCALDYISIQRAYITGNRVSVGSVILRKSGGKVALRGSTLTDLICMDVPLLQLDLQDSTISNEFKLWNITAREALNLQRFQCTGRAAFEGCTFHEVPNVHGAVFPSDTVFIGCRFGFPRNPRSWRRPAPSIKTAENYRALRMSMKSAGAGLEEMRFFALEMRERRRIKNHPTLSASCKVSRTDRMISLLYDLISCYGTSIGRALSAFALWNCIFLAIFFAFGQIGLISAPNKPPMCSGTQGVPAIENVLLTYPAVGYTLQNIINPSATVSKSGLMPIGSGPVLVLSIIQSLGSLAIVAMLLLAIRGKFQRGG
jgi:hypothetical protein